MCRKGWRRRESLKEWLVQQNVSRLGVPFSTLLKKSIAYCAGGLKESSRRGRIERVKSRFDAKFPGGTEPSPATIDFTAEEWAIVSELALDIPNLDLPGIFNLSIWHGVSFFIINPDSLCDYDLTERAENCQSGNGRASVEIYE